MGKEAVITANQLAIGYASGKKGEKRIQENLSFSLYQGELTCLLGPNGAGKSTLLRTLGTSQRPLLGNILLQGKSIGSYTEREISRLIGVVLTDKTAAGGLTVAEMVSLGRQPHTGFFGKLGNRDYQTIEESMDSVGILHKATHYIAELSDGERQKAMIAKALAQECPIVLLDEPTAFLDIVSRIEIMNLLHRLAYTQKKTILLSTHDLEQALLLSDRLWLLSRKNGLQSGVPEDLVLNDSMDKLFGRKDISFDKQTGNFRFSFGHTHTIGVEAPGELHFWIKNAIVRNGFECRPVGEEPLEESVHATAPNHIEIRKAGNKKIILHSFEEFTDYLIQQKHG